MTAATNPHLYDQVADDLRRQIASGQLAVGDKIPSTARLAELHDVSKGVIQTAVKVLKDEGLVVGQTGKGVLVRATPETAAAEAKALKSVDEQLAELRGEVERLSDLQPAEASKVEALQAEVGKLGANLRHLYDRLGQPYPRGNNSTSSKPKRRQSGA